MAKKKSSKKEILSVLLIILVGILVFLSPFLLTAVLATAFPSVDGYLLTGFSFCVFGFVALLSGTIAVFRVFVPKENKLDYFKSVYKRYKQMVQFFILPMLIILFLFEFAIAYRGYTYLKDIVQGPKEAIMKDAVVEAKSSKGIYLVGYVDGKKIRLSITRGAHSAVSRRESYKMLWIEYYEGIQEVYEIDIFMK